MPLIPSLTTCGNAVASVVAPTKRSLVKALGGVMPPTPAACNEVPTKSPKQLRYEQDDERVKQLKEDCRNHLRGMSLCGITAMCGASAFMQLTIIFWPVAVLMIWGACEVGWSLACAWKEHCKEYDAAVKRRDKSLDAWEQETHQKAYTDAARASQQMSDRLLPSPVYALRDPSAPSATRPKND